MLYRGAMDEAILAAAGAGLSLADWLDRLITEVAAKEKEYRGENQKDKEAD
jgi:hypothetical protein